MKVNPKWDKMVGYDFENISQGFWVVSGARVGYIPFSGSVYYESQPKFLFSLMFCFLHNRTLRQDGRIWVWIVFCAWAWVHLGARYESQIKISKKTLLTKGDQHTEGAQVIVSHYIVNKYMASVFSYILWPLLDSNCPVLFGLVQVLILVPPM